jgi:hypothetical protein
MIPNQEVQDLPQLELRGPQAHGLLQIKAGCGEGLLAEHELHARQLFQALDRPRRLRIRCSHTGAGLD